MSSIPDQIKLRQAAAALIDIDAAGNLRELGDAIMAARREHKRQTMDRPIGHDVYVSQLATVLGRTTGIPYRLCYSAISEAISPEWASVAIDTIIGYQAEEVWR